ncbi:MAG: hypothetical protein U5J96_15675 [Ignavibacteriaceae bacterium]|nr:hypothetical protein [Ignavibacteriaceae bacterium]
MTGQVQQFISVFISSTVTSWTYHDTIPDDMVWDVETVLAGDLRLFIRRMVWRGILKQKV